MWGLGSDGIVGSLTTTPRPKPGQIIAFGYWVLGLPRTASPNSPKVRSRAVEGSGLTALASPERFTPRPTSVFLFSRDCTTQFAAVGCGYSARHPPLPSEGPSTLDCEG